MKLTIQQQILKDLFKKSGLKSQKEFAQHHNLYPEKLSEWMTGKVVPKSATVELIAMDEGYEIELHYLLKPINQ